VIHLVTAVLRSGSSVSWLTNLAAKFNYINRHFNSDETSAGKYCGSPKMKNLSLRNPELRDLACTVGRFRDSFVI
jgi:hypothetical protein